MIDKIDKNIPLPPRSGGARNAAEYHEVWLKLKPGDSVFYDMEDYDPRILQQKIMARKRTFLSKHKLKWEMTTRIVEGGVRIWRIK